MCCSFAGSLFCCGPNQPAADTPLERGGRLPKNRARIPPRASFNPTCLTTPFHFWMAPGAPGGCSPPHHRAHHQLEVAGSPGPTQRSARAALVRSKAAGSGRGSTRATAESSSRRGWHPSAPSQLRGLPPTRDVRPGGAGATCGWAATTTLSSNSATRARSSASSRATSAEVPLMMRSYHSTSYSSST